MERFQITDGTVYYNILITLGKPVQITPSKNKHIAIIYVKSAVTTAMEYLQAQGVDVRLVQLDDRKIKYTY